MAASIPPTNSGMTWTSNNLPFLELVFGGLVVRWNQISGRRLGPWSDLYFNQFREYLDFK